MGVLEAAASPLEKSSLMMIYILQTHSLGSNADLVRDNMVGYNVVKHGFYEELSHHLYSLSIECDETLSLQSSIHFMRKVSRPTNMI